jgi:hypothetical protein
MIPAFENAGLTGHDEGDRGGLALEARMVLCEVFHVSVEGCGGGVEVDL